MRYCPLTKKYEDDCGPCEMCPAEQGIEIPLSDLEGGKKLKEENERYARMLIQDTPAGIKVDVEGSAKIMGRMLTQVLIEAARDPDSQKMIFKSFMLSVTVYCLYESLAGNDKPVEELRAHVASLEKGIAELPKAADLKK